MTHSRGGSVLGTAAALLTLGALSPGCSWVERSRPIHEGEQLHAESAALAVPPGAWTAKRSDAARDRSFRLVAEAGEGRPVRLLVFSERDLPVTSSGEVNAARLSRSASEALGFAASDAGEFHVPLPARFGVSASTVAVKVTERDTTSGQATGRAVRLAELSFVSSDRPTRTCRIVYAEAEAAGASDDRFLESWRAILDGTEVRPASAGRAAASAQADEFPKTFESGLARRSLTLPWMGLQLGLGRERWLATGESPGILGDVEFGVTDHLQLATPGVLRYAFGQREAVTRPELAIEAGLRGFEHDDVRGNVWTFGGGALGRWRLSPDMALRGMLLASGAHESKTGKTRPGGGAVAGAVWDVHRYVSLGLESGWDSLPEASGYRTRFWVGGLATSLVTFHLTIVDLGLDAAAAWKDGQPGFVVGGHLLVTL